MINWQQLKEKYAQFKHWQREPIKYIDCDDVHYCYNCGLMFAGNFCPRCSQKAETGRISWKSVRHGIMDLWGLGTRSVLYSIFQLLLRPGYFISDYISGKRQVSFPPVKMLFIVTVIYSLIFYWLFPQVLGIELNENGDSQKMFNEFYKWQNSHFSWAMLATAVLSIIPTWIMFRYSPRNTRHSLPEGFFIQVLFSVLMVVLNFFYISLTLIHPSVFSITISLFTMFYYIVGYMQLFGYSFWGTLWRQAFIMFAIAFIEFALIFAIFKVDISEMTKANLTHEQTMLWKYILAGSFVFITAMILAVGHVVNLIATRKARKEFRQSQLGS